MMPEAAYVCDTRPLFFVFPEKTALLLQKMKCKPDAAPELPEITIEIAAAI